MWKQFDSFVLAIILESPIVIVVSFKLFLLNSPGIRPISGKCTNSQFCGDVASYRDK